MREQPGPARLQDLCKSRLFRQTVVAYDIVSAVTERGSYPFPFRTRKSSPSSPMVPGPRARESRSPLDSRGPLPSRQGASSFYMTARAIVTVQLRLALALATVPGQYRALVAHAPFTVNSGRGFFYIPLARIVIPAKAGISLPSCVRYRPLARILYFVSNVLLETYSAVYSAALRVVVCDSCFLWNGDLGYGSSDKHGL